MQSLSRSIVAIPLLFLLCLDAGAKSGPKFEPEQSPPADHGVVYVYRDFNLIGGGASYMVQVNGVPAAYLPSHGYFVYFAKPGEVEFSARTEAKTSVTLDVEAGKTYFIKGTIGVGVFVGHPHLVAVPNDIGEAEIADCKLVPDGRITMGQEPKHKGPFDDAVVEIALTDLGMAPVDTSTLPPLEVIDKRTEVRMERTALGKTMGAVVMKPGEAELIRSVIGAKLQQVMGSLPAASNGTTPVVCEIVEFAVTTPSTALYWDATTDIALTLRVGEGERSVKGHGVKRTYVNPSAKVIKPAAVDALKQVADASEAALRELLQ